MSYDKIVLRAELTRDEGRKRFAYDDADGLPPKGLRGKLTIGVGWNLTDNGLPDEIIDALLDIGIRNAELTLNSRVPGWPALDGRRQRALLNLAFNLGNRLVNFPKFLAAANAHDWPAACEELRTALWYSQVGPRADRIIGMLRDGVALSTPVPK